MQLHPFFITRGSTGWSLESDPVHILAQEMRMPKILFYTLCVRCPGTEARAWSMDETRESKQRKGVIETRKSKLGAYHPDMLSSMNNLALTWKRQGRHTDALSLIEDCAQARGHQGAAGQEVGPAFEASLATHLIYFRRCEQNWRWFVRDMEDQVRNSFIMAKVAPFELPEDKPTPPGDSQRMVPPDVLLSEKRRIIQSIKKLQSIGRHAIAPGTTREPPKQPPSPGLLARAADTPRVLDTFGHNELLRLGLLAERLEEATLVLYLNIGVLRDVAEYYQHAVQSGEIKPDVRSSMARSAATFQRRLQQITRSLETSHTQFLSIRKKFDYGKGWVSVTQHPTPSKPPIILLTRVSTSTPPTAKPPSQPAVRRTRTPVCPQHGEHRAADGTRDGIDAHHHRGHPALPAGHVPRRKIPLPFTSNNSHTNKHRHFSKAVCSNGQRNPTSSAAGCFAWMSSTCSWLSACP